MKFCLAGHNEYEWKFGRDMSRDDRRNPYCRAHIVEMARNRRVLLEQSDLEPVFTSEPLRERSVYVPEPELEPQPVRRFDPFEVDEGSIWVVAAKLAGHGGPKKFKPAWEIR